MPIRTLIVDDEPLARERLRALLESESRVEVVGEAADGCSALQRIEELDPELVFLDIQMPEKSGIEVAQALQASSHPLPAIVFVTAYDAFALQAFDLHAVDYLLKPFDRQRFKTALEKAIATQQQREARQLDQRLAALLRDLPRAKSHLDRLSIKTDGRVLLVRVDEIDWIAAANNYVEVHHDGTTHLMRETLSQLEEQLDPRQFLRISRSTIVAIDKIREIHPLFHGEHTVVLSDGSRLTASRGYRDAIKPLLGK